MLSVSLYCFFYCFKVLLWKSSDDLSCFGEFPLQCSISVQYKLHYLVFRNHSAPLASLVVAFPFVNDDINIYIYWQWPLCGSVKYNTTIIPSYNTPKPLPSLCFLLIITPVTCPAESLNTHPGFFVCLFVCFTVDVLPVADVLQVASRLLPAQIRLLVVRLQPGVSISAELGAGGHAARGRAPHLYPPNTHTHTQLGRRWV